jgi:hypothetical protein
LDLLFQLLAGLALQRLVGALEVPELVGILIILVEPEVLGMLVLTTAEAAALLAFLGMAETAEIAVQQAQPAILEAEAGLLAGQLDRAYSAFQQPFLVHLLILLRLELVATPLVRLVTAAELQEAQEALDRVYPAVGLQTLVLQAVAVS